jgi:hypothetical protein
MSRLLCQVDGPSRCTSSLEDNDLEKCYWKLRLPVRPEDDTEAERGVCALKPSVGEGDGKIIRRPEPNEANPGTASRRALSLRIRRANMEQLIARANRLTFCHLPMKSENDSKRVMSTSRT